MIFTFTDLDKGMDKIFHGRSTDIYEWTSKIPSPDIEQSLLWDPALIEDLYKDKFRTGASVIANAYLYNTVTASRVAIGKIAQTLGILQTQFTNVSNIFQESADNIEIIIRTFDAILESEYFQKGLDAIGAIPIVGWIIKIIVKIAEAVYKIVKVVQTKNADKVKKYLADQKSIPLAKFSTETDEFLARNTMLAIKNYEMNYIFSPRYLYDNYEDIVVVPEKLKPEDSLTRVFNVRSVNELGLGAIPGTVNLLGALRFPTRGCAEIYDTGDLYPTAKNLAASLFQIIQKPGPALYSLNTAKLSTLWIDNIYSLLEYAESSIRKGWTCKETGIIDTDTFFCVNELLGSYKECKNKGDVNLKNKIKIKGNGHYEAFRKHIFGKFFEGVPPTKNPGKYGLNDIDLNQSIPVKALKNIKETQKAILNSLTCAYINEEKNAYGRYIFEGLVSDNNYRKIWRENVTTLLNSNDWRKIYFLDVPDGPFKNDLYQKAKKYKFDPIKPGPIDSMGTKTMAGKSVLGDPSPPAPVKPVDVLNGLDMKKQVSKTSSGSSSGILTLGALAGIGFLVSRK